ncbi:MAG: dephospho-CoA kinase [Puniceicoccaceae bacterium]
MNVGLTGGIGCGKSTVLEFFRQAGAAVLDTDAVVRELLQTDTELIASIAEAFGKGVLDDEGKVDRARLAATVFNNSKALALLESLVHPRVREYWMRELHEKHPVLIVEIPLLFEKDLQGHFSTTICVGSYPEVQLKRLKARGMTESDIENRKKRQLSLEEKMQKADIVIHNNGTREHLKEQVEWIMKRLRGA